MSFLDRLGGLPIGILPGTVPDDPALPTQTAPTVKRPDVAPQPLTGRQLALQAAQDLKDLLYGIRQLVRLQESSTRAYLMSGSLAGGGTIGTAATSILNANANRNGLSVQNVGTAGNLTLGLGTTSPQSGTGIVLQPGSSWDGRVSGQMWRGSVSIIGSAAGVVYSFLEA
jgi:hypothetical protein